MVLFQWRVHHIRNFLNIFDAVPAALITAPLIRISLGKKMGCWTLGRGGRFLFLWETRHFVFSSSIGGEISEAAPRCPPPRVHPVSKQVFKWECTNTYFLTQYHSTNNYSKWWPEWLINQSSIYALIYRVRCLDEVAGATSSSKFHKFDSTILFGTPSKPLITPCSVFQPLSKAQQKVTRSPLDNGSNNNDNQDYLGSLLICPGEFVNRWSGWSEEKERYITYYINKNIINLTCMTGRLSVHIFTYIAYTCAQCMKCMHYIQDKYIDHLTLALASWRGI
jgi:hypothetical protein